jgi:hypothetical protein
LERRTHEESNTFAKRRARLSDGKLTSAARKTERAGKVLEDARAFGAPEEIAFGKAHIATASARVRLRHAKEIERLGGEVRFDTRLAALKQERQGLQIRFCPTAKRNLER